MKPTILLQLDPDPHPSVFDSVVALDSGVDHLLRHGGVTPASVRDLVHGALFTRGGDDLRRTAIFVGGSDVIAAEAILDAVTQTFFADFRVSVLLDPNGANTTAAAAVLAALEGSGGSVKGRRVAVLGATGPVGRRVARLLGREGATVAVGSRQLDRSEAVARDLASSTGAIYLPFANADLASGLAGASIVVAAGAAGTVLLPEPARKALPDLKVLIDLNAVPPLGIEGVKATDRDTSRDGTRAWGALGVGATKMKIHKAAVARLFTARDLVLDAEAVLELGRTLG